ncbi:hypothetical protein M0O54_20150, partial [Acinetobacter lactucae]
TKAIRSLSGSVDKLNFEFPSEHRFVDPPTASYAQQMQEINVDKAPLHFSEQLKLIMQEEILRIETSCKEVQHVLTNMQLAINP